MINWLILLTAKRTCSKLLKAVPFSAIRRPNTAMQREPEEKFDLWRRRI
jgi:hypothetical protein